jgi:2-iminobutanoate/2-iminopropanoate deaminase
MSYSDVVSNRVYLRDGRHFQGMNDAYKAVFTENPPARATVRSGLMHPDLLVEIQATAVKDAARKIAGNARPGSPLSPSVVAGKRQFLSGMLGRGPSGYAPGDVQAQTRQAIERLKTTLTAAGLSLEDVVESVVFLTDIRHFSAMNEIYRELIPSPRPSRTTIGTALMSPDALVEIMMLADNEK